MDYEKKYNEALERARNLYPSVHEHNKKMLEQIFPELRESEDERARKWLVALVENLGDPADEEAEKELEVMRPLALAYLEKQKENQKNTISIPADCASNAKCPYKIHGDEEFIGDIKDTPAYHFGFDEGVRSEREKQKEQKLYEPKNWPADKDTITQEQKPVVTHGEPYLVDTLGTQQEIAGKMPQKPAEWSEEDTLMLTAIIQTLETFGGRGTTGMQIAWLKSLRPQPHWKPSEEQMRDLEGTIKYYGSQVPEGLKSLYEQLKNL